MEVVVLQQHTPRVQYISDIHLEHMRILNAEQLNPEQWVTPDPTADVLVLAGDIGWPDKPAYGLFLQWCSEHWPHVIVVAGNHEFYTTGGASVGSASTTGGIPALSRYEKMNLIRLISRSLPNVHYLQEGRFEVQPGVWILGCTLWSAIPEDMRKYALAGLNDFRQIYGSDVSVGTTFEEYARWHKRDRDWLREELGAIKARGEFAIVVTHHLPTMRLIHAEYADHPLNCCFATDLEALILEMEPLAWICGHSHRANHMWLGSTQLALNPMGYPGERVGPRNRQAVLEVVLPTAPAAAGVVSAVAEQTHPHVIATPIVVVD